MTFDMEVNVCVRVCVRAPRDIIFDVEENFDEVGPAVIPRGSFQKAIV